MVCSSGLDDFDGKLFIVSFLSYLVLSTTGSAHETGECPQRQGKDQHIESSPDRLQTFKPMENRRKLSSPTCRELHERGIQHSDPQAVR